MSLFKVGVCAFAFAMAVASAASSYSVTFFQPSIINGKELKPGDYRIDVDGEKALVKAGKNTWKQP